MTNPLAQDLGGVVRLLEKATPGKWNHYESKYDGDVYMVQAAPPKMHVLCRYNGDGAGYTQQDVDNAAAIAACVNFLRTHSAEIAGALRDAERWQPIESAPRDGSYILVCNSHGSWIAKYQHFYPSGYRPSSPWASMMLNHDHIEKPGRLDHPTHWRPLPAPPTDYAARAGERGGES